METGLVANFLKVKIRIFQNKATRFYEKNEKLSVFLGKLVNLAKNLEKQKILDYLPNFIRIFHFISMHSSILQQLLQSNGKQWNQMG